MRTRTSVIALLAGTAGAVVTALGIAWVARSRGDQLAPDGVVEGGRDRRGRPEDRGRTPAYGVDIERLGASTEISEPAVEYLTYIQMQRGAAGQHLLFVRHEDLDAMAALEGADTSEFLERLQHLGVVVSNN